MGVKKRLFYGLCVFASVIMVGTGLYGTYRAVYIKAFVEGGRAELINETYFQFALLHEMETADTHKDFEKVKDMLEIHARSNWLSIRSTQGRMEATDFLRLRRAAEKVFGGRDASD